MLRRRWFVIVAALAIGLALAWVTLPSPSADAKAAKKDVSFKASAVIVSPPGSKNSLNQFAVFATKGPIPLAVANQLGVKVGAGNGGAAAAATGSKKAVAAAGAVKTAQIGSTSVRVQPDAGSGSITIVATDKDKATAIAVANGLANGLIAKEGQTATAAQSVKLSQLERAVNNAKVGLYVAQVGWARDPKNSLAKQNLNDAQNRYQTAQDRLTAFNNQGPAAPPLSLLQAAEAERITKKSNGLTAPTSKTTRLVLGGGLGLILGLGLALLLERFDAHVRTASAAEKVAQLPVIAEVPHVRMRKHNRDEILTLVAPKSQYAEAYRGLRTSVSLMSMARAAAAPASTNGHGDELHIVATEPQVILITSPGPNEGKTTTSANIATTFAGMGASVILIDLDFRRQKLFRMVGAQPGPHLTNTGELGGELRVDLASVIQPTSIPGVRFVPSAPRDAMPEHALRLARAAIEAARKSADIVILDGPPLLLTNDVRELITSVDAVVLLAREGRTQRRGLARASQLLHRIDAPVVGLAFIGSHGNRREYGYGENYGYGYGYRAPRKPRKDTRPIKVKSKVKAPAKVEETVISLEDPPIPAPISLEEDSRERESRVWPRR